MKKWPAPSSRVASFWLFLVLWLLHSCLLKILLWNEVRGQTIICYYFTELCRCMSMPHFLNTHLNVQMGCLPAKLLMQQPQSSMQQFWFWSALSALATTMLINKNKNKTMVKDLLYIFGSNFCFTEKILNWITLASTNSNDITLCIDIR